MKSMEKNRIKKVIVTALVAISVLAVMVFAYADNKQEIQETDDTSKVPVIENSVTIGKKTYTKDKPLKVVEIVPLKFQSELGYLIGSDYYNVKFEDIKELILSGNTNGKSLLQNWWYRIGAIYGGQYSIQFYVKGVDGTYGWSDGFPNDGRIVLDEKLDYRIKDNNGNIYRYKDENGNVINSTNIFAYSVFGDYNMADKIVYEAKTPGELSEEDIDSADLIYINTAAGFRDNANINFYKQANQYMPEKCPMTVNGVTYTDAKKFLELNEDFDAETAWYLYRAIAAEDIAIVFDTNQIAQYFDKDSNAVKLSYMLNGVDRDKFKEHFWQKEVVAGKSYSGSLGTFEIADNTFKITYTYYNQYNTSLPAEPGKELAWNQQMFINSDFIYSICKGEGNEDNKNYYYLSPDYSGNERSTNVWNNVFSYGDWNTLLQQVPAGTITANYNMSGSSYNDVYHLYGIDGKISVGSAIRYILGDYVKLSDNKILDVLEIEPAGTYKYNNLTDAQAKQILKYLQISIKDMKEGNIAGHVQVNSVAMNEFIAMKEDIKNNYDLIIIGDVTNTEYTSRFFSKYIYSEYGKEVEYTNYYEATQSIIENVKTVYSGNDLTENAFNELKEYMESGKPMVLADTIYSGNIEKIDSSSNVYKLSEIAQNCKNVTDESMTLGGRVTYIERPSVNVEGYGVTYKDVNVTVNQNKEIKTKVANINLIRENLSDFEFKVNTGDSLREYNLEIYVDKNGDGIFTGTGEDNELVYGGSYGSYTHKLSLPTGLRGYLKWKVVLTDNKTGMSADEEGAFVVNYGSEEKRTVKVLHICSNGNNLSLKSDKFLKLFGASSDITGLIMTADDITVMTTAQYQASYENSPYDPATGAGDKLTKDGDIGYDIIVMGFEDGYGYEDISDENGALSNLVDYIEAGNSVLMSHDVLSSRAYSDKDNTNLHTCLKYGDLSNKLDWSYNITSALRNIIGMDRYNVAVDVKEGKNTDVLYGQGYSNSLYLTGTRYNSNMASQINSGQINMYPYEIGEDVSVAKTHLQYFQLDMNADDVVVWYALSSDLDSEETKNYRYYTMSGNDALNNYYIYSKGNVTYTGAGHSALSDSDIELQLFVNTIIKAIASANSLPDVEYENAIKVSDSSYEITIRDGKLPETITYKVTDKDFLGDTNGTFKEAYVFFDTDGDGKYIEGTDILFRAYDSDENTELEGLRNMTPETLDFASDTGILSQWKNSGDNKKKSDAEAIEEAFENNQLRIIVQVRDNNNGIGRGTLDIVNKQLFNLN